MIKLRPVYEFLKLLANVEVCYIFPYSYHGYLQTKNKKQKPYSKLYLMVKYLMCPS